MKKLMLILAIGAFVACNDNADSTELPQDSVPAIPAPAPPVEPQDTTLVVPQGDSTIAPVQ